MWAFSLQRIVVWSASAAMAGAMAQPVGERPNVSPGLWEIETVATISGANVPPAMSVPRTLKYHSCVTEQNVRESFADAMQQKRGDCVKSNEQSSSSGLSLDFSCQNGAMSGHVEVVFDSDSAAHGSMHASGQVGNMTMQSSSITTGRRISGDCGSVAPGHPQMIH